MSVRPNHESMWAWCKWFYKTEMSGQTGRKEKVSKKGARIEDRDYPTISFPILHREQATVYNAAMIPYHWQNNHSRFIRDSMVLYHAEKTVYVQLAQDSLRGPLLLLRT